MRHLLLAGLIIGAFLIAWTLQAQEEYSGYCTPSHLHNRCHCLGMASDGHYGYEDCDEDEKVRDDHSWDSETNRCTRYCRKDLCMCCKTYHDHNKKK